MRQNRTLRIIFQPTTILFFLFVVGVGSGYPSFANQETDAAALKGKIEQIDTEAMGKEYSRQLLHGNSDRYCLMDNTSKRTVLPHIETFNLGIKILDPAMASFVHVNLCMAPPTAPYSKHQWDLLQEERIKSPLATAWRNWEENLGNYLCRYWSNCPINIAGMGIYHVIVKERGKITEIKISPLSEASDRQFLDYGIEKVDKLSGYPILCFPHLSRVKEIHLEIGLISRRNLEINN